MTELKTKLLLIAKLPPPFGGLSIITRSFLKAGLANHFELIHLNTSQNTPTEKFGKITLHDIFITLKNYFFLLIICLRTRKLKYALLTGTSGSGLIRDYGYLLLLRIFKIRIIYNLHGTRKQWQRNRLLQRLCRSAITKSELILAPTRVDQDIAREFTNQPQKIRLYYNSTFVRESYLAANDMRQASGALQVIGIGRLSQAKGAFDLMNTVIDLLREGKDIRLVWVGRGAFPADDRKAEEILDKNRDLIAKDKILILKDIDDDQKFTELQRASLFALPSYSENLPISILEAMALGLPVISTRTGAIPEVIEDGKNGWLMDCGDQTALKNKLDWCLTHRDELLGIGDENRREFQAKYATQRRIEELSEYIHQSQSIS